MAYVLSAGLFTMSSHALATLAGALGAGSVAEAQQVYVAGKGVGATQAGADEFGRLVTACKSTGSEKERRVLMGAIASDAGVDPDQLSEMVGSPRRGRILPFGDFVGSLPIGMLTGAVGRRATGGEMEAAAGAALRSAGVTVSVSAPPIRAQGASGAGSAPASRAEDPYEKIFDKISPNPTDEELRGLIIAVNAVKSTRPMPLPQGFEKLKALQNAITTALKDSSADLRLAAVNVMEKLAVARFGGRWMVGLLAKAMFDPDEGVRDAAQRVIETKIGVYADYGDVLSDLQQDNRFRKDVNKGAAIISIRVLGTLLRMAGRAWRDVCRSLLIERLWSEDADVRNAAVKELADSQFALSVGEKGSLIAQLNNLLIDREIAGRRAAAVGVIRGVLAYVDARGEGTQDVVRLPYLWMLGEMYRHEVDEGVIAEIRTTFRLMADGHHGEDVREYVNTFARELGEHQVFFGSIEAPERPAAD